ncbi:hypothetical protein T2_00042 [Ralstonia phage Elie]|uniref:Uncharacterized protein n=3 Tax=Bakolyvirus TaxID=2843355 RepID=A0A7G5BBS1_9CAUD|nr:hypothetical protein KE332_gp42 [Ralstonia phage Adzire]YP_010052765.1 hypothetical protein KE333_gp16 [Ralstonia phage Bakoly]YP_010077729.1 hypothetical protein KMC38_gp42 [Ralstonia phage Simangalove]QMV32987.1 hypothetical protein T2_00042 [Ralstonia phage Elie]QMV33699.1 hypothetical protein S3_00055 [Ralstonia phage Sarlave]QMV32359.1 hypothetical protein S1_00042 [Ralstonia phage Adzire]QMV32589.1 hypothetical protein 2B_00016 [Ralstonia phage Bakoly]QMV33744.1 hypothetical protein
MTTGSYQPFQVRRAKVTVHVSRPDGRGNMKTTDYVFELHRMRIRVQQGGAAFGNASIEVFGVPLASMNNIARLLFQPMDPSNNDSVDIAVWDGKVFVPLFSGVITWSAADLSQMPQAKLVIEANSAFRLMNDPAPPYANPGPVLLSAAIRAIVAPAGFMVDFYGTDQTLTSVRVEGSRYDQVAKLFEGFPSLSFYNSLQRLVVRDVDAPIDAKPIRVAPDSGLISYPVYSSSGMTFVTVFNPQMIPGIPCKFTTGLTFIDQTTWCAALLAHELDVNLPGGAWQTSVAANPASALPGT